MGLLLWRWRDYCVWAWSINNKKSLQKREAVWTEQSTHNRREFWRAWSHQTQWRRLSGGDGREMSLLYSPANSLDSWPPKHKVRNLHCVKPFCGQWYITLTKRSNDRALLFFKELICHAGWAPLSLTAWWKERTTLTFTQMLGYTCLSLKHSICTHIQ